MNDYPDFVKGRLFEIIDNMTADPKAFVKNPEIDFIRNRKLSFENVLKFTLSLGTKTLTGELMDYFDYDINTASSSALIQQRDKLKANTFEYLLKEFTNSFKDLKTFEGYRLLAVDGSDLNICHNPNDEETYFQSIPDTKGFNKLHINAMYDLRNKIYVDALVQPGRKENEHSALAEMIDRSVLFGKVISIQDRGYESYNSIAHYKEKGWKYVTRVKDINSNGILSTLELPSEDVFDININLVLTKKRTKETIGSPETYKILAPNATFDYLDSQSNEYYPISFRVVRFKITDNTYETVITNLDSIEFPPKKIKKLYHLRWGIETSFRELKYAIGLLSFHSKKVDHITHEIFARLVMYNFCELITMNVVIQQKDTKYFYQVNFTEAIRICKRYFKCQGNSPLNVEGLIRKNILPVREGRSAPRKIKSKTAVSFLYRTA